MGSFAIDFTELLGFYPKDAKKFARLLHELNLCHSFSSKLVYEHSSGFLTT